MLGFVNKTYIESPRLAYRLLGAGLVICGVLPVIPFLRFGSGFGRVLIALAIIVAARSWDRRGSRIVMALGVLELGFSLVTSLVWVIIYPVVIGLVGGWSVQ
ncbi:hypothetical protein [Tautonia rosea]|uniref:hypothetical protein n=1 Tax=Tautonia rosea TaxID=2728037 RepID=UPI001475CDCF|nr:hypothetical protein [Tautonia rosea]